MNNKLKGLVAAAAGLVMLVATGSTFAVWQASASFDEDSVTVGRLAVAAEDLEWDLPAAGFWHPGTSASAWTPTFDIDLQGEGLLAGLLFAGEAFEAEAARVGPFDIGLTLEIIVTGQDDSVTLEFPLEFLDGAWRSTMAPGQAALLVLSESDLELASYRIRMDADFPLHRAGGGVWGYPAAPGVQLLAGDGGFRNFSPDSLVPTDFGVVLTQWFPEAAPEPVE